MTADYALGSLSNDRLLADMAALLVADRATTAKLLAHIGEVDARKLYCARGYSSMHAYCTGALHLSEAAAYKRIVAARAARRFPVIYELVARGQVHVSGIAVLAPHLSADNHGQLLARATHQTNTAVLGLGGVRDREHSPASPGYAAQRGGGRGRGRRTAARRLAR